MARNRSPASRESHARALGSAPAVVMQWGEPIFRDSGREWTPWCLSPDDPTTDDEPGYTLCVESGRMVVRHTGRLTVQAIEASRRAVAELAAERRLAHILLDLSGATSGLAPAEIFELCASQGFVLPPCATVAVVHRPDQFSAEDGGFAETVSLNRGVRLRAFTSLEAAQRWLGAETAGTAR
jgi:hypothetical protein